LHRLVIAVSAASAAFKVSSSVPISSSTRLRSPARARKLDAVKKADGLSVGRATFKPVAMRASVAPINWPIFCSCRTPCRAAADNKKLSITLSRDPNSNSAFRKNADTAFFFISYSNHDLIYI